MKVKAKTKPEQVKVNEPMFSGEKLQEVQERAFKLGSKNGFQKGVKNALAYLVVKGVIEPDQAIDAALNGLDETYTFSNESPF